MLKSVLKTPLHLSRLLLAAALLSGCPMNGATDQSSESFVRSDNVAPGTVCAAGGVKITLGSINTANQVETIQREVLVCNGAPGAAGVPGTNGLQAVFSVVPVSAGSTDCADGGSRVQLGYDKNGNKTLDITNDPNTNELVQTTLVCNGTAGQMGAAGMQGPQGPVARLTLLPEAAGVNCPAGGIRVTDSSTTYYVCNGINGFNSLSLVTDLMPGQSGCPAGGYRIETGLDTSRNNILDASEVQSTRVSCYQACLEETRLGLDTRKFCPERGTFALFPQPIGGVGPMAVSREGDVYLGVNHFPSSGGLSPHLIHRVLSSGVIQLNFSTAPGASTGSFRGSDLSVDPTSGNIIWLSTLLGNNSTFTNTDARLFRVDPRNGATTLLRSSVGITADTLLATGPSSFFVSGARWMNNGTGTFSVERWTGSAFVSQVYRDLPILSMGRSPNPDEFIGLYGLFVGRFPPTLTPYDSPTTLGMLTFDQRSSRIAVDPAGQWVYMNCLDAPSGDAVACPIGSVIRVNTQTGVIEQVTDSSRYAVALAFGPNSRVLHVLFRRGTPALTTGYDLERIRVY